MIDLQQLANKLSPEKWYRTYSTNKPGPKILLVGGIHGNEWGGVEAINEWIDYLEGNQNTFDNGEVHFLIANPKALEINQRYVDFDLNRAFDNPNAHGYEAKRAKELEKIFTDTSFDIVIDLHSVSIGEEQMLVLDIEDKEAFKLAKAVSSISTYLLFDQNHVEGIMVAFGGKHGSPGIVVECGNHLSPFASRVASFHIYNTLKYYGVVQNPISCFEELSEFVESPEEINIYETIEAVRPEPGFHYVTKELFTGLKLSPGETYAKSDIREYQAREECAIVLPSNKVKLSDYNVGLICRHKTISRQGG